MELAAVGVLNIGLHRLNQGAWVFIRLGIVSGQTLVQALEPRSFSLTKCN
jgi:hypothetical protein